MGDSGPRSLNSLLSGSALHDPFSLTIIGLEPFEAPPREAFKKSVVVGPKTFRSDRASYSQKLRLMRAVTAQARPKAWPGVLVIN